MNRLSFPHFIRRWRDRRDRREPNGTYREPEGRVVPVTALPSGSRSCRRFTLGIACQLLPFRLRVVRSSSLYGGCSVRYTFLRLLLPPPSATGGTETRVRRGHWHTDDTHERWDKLCTRGALDSSLHLHFYPSLFPFCSPSLRGLPKDRRGTVKEVEKWIKGGSVIHLVGHSVSHWPILTVLSLVTHSRWSIVRIERAPRQGVSRG